MDCQTSMIRSLRDNLIRDHDFNFIFPFEMQHKYILCWNLEQENSSHACICCTRYNQSSVLKSQNLNSLTQQSFKGKQEVIQQLRGVAALEKKMPPIAELKPHLQ